MISEGPERRFVGTEETSALMPNGFAIRRDGSVVLANVGPDHGVWTMTPEGEAAPLAILEGSSNFVLATPDDQVWASVLTRAGHGAPLSAHRTDGYIVRFEDGEPKVVIDGLISANEFRIDYARGVLYVNETFAHRTSRFDLSPDGVASNKVVLAQYDENTYPDGMALDANGDLWVVSIISNRILHVTKTGDVRVLFEDNDADRMAACAHALATETLTRELVYQTTGAALENPSSIAFGGPDLKTLYLGSLGGPDLKAFDSPVAGAPMAHWDWT